MAKFDVVVFGGTNVGMGAGCSCGCAGCGGVQNVEAEFDRMVANMRERYNEEEVAFSFVNTEGKPLGDFPTIEEVIMKGYAFPITVINGTPYLAGAIDKEAVEEILAEINGGCGCSCDSCGGCGQGC